MLKQYDFSSVNKRCGNQFCSSFCYYRKICLFLAEENAHLGKRQLYPSHKHFSMVSYFILELWYMVYLDKPHTSMLLFPIILVLFPVYFNSKLKTDACLTERSLCFWKSSEVLIFIFSQPHYGSIPHSTN